MSDIDLIPQAYRIRLWQTSWIKRSALLLGGLVGLLIVGSIALGVATANAKSRVAALQLKQELTTQQRADMDRLGVEKSDLEHQFHLLSGLRSGAAAGDMFLTIDRALTGDDVWFLDWQFQRAGVMAGEEVRTVNTGYFIVVPDGAAELAADELRVQTHMTIRGQARDHSALSGFVRRLFTQPEIDDVRILRTALSNSRQTSTVDFELAVVLSTDVGGT
jgi:Tfp pilus assembly protein PilN